MLKRFIIEAEERPIYDLRCPHKDCDGLVTIDRRDLKVSRFLARPCVHCFRPSWLPQKLQNYVRKHGPQDVPGPPSTARK